MTHRNVANSLIKVGTGEDDAHSAKVTEHMRLKVPQAIILALTELTTTMALTRQLQKTPYIQPQMTTQIPKDRLWEPLIYDCCLQRLQYPTHPHPVPATAALFSEDPPDCSLSESSCLLHYSEETSRLQVHCRGFLCGFLTLPGYLFFLE